MRFLAVVFVLLALACGLGAVAAIVAAHILQGLLLMAVGCMFAAGGAWAWEHGRP